MLLVLRVELWSIGVVVEDGLITVVVVRGVVKPGKVDEGKEAEGMVVVVVAIKIVEDEDRGINVVVVVVDDEENKGVRVPIGVMIVVVEAAAVEIVVVVEEEMGEVVIKIGFIIFMVLVSWLDWRLVPVEMVDDAIAWVVNGWVRIEVLPPLTTAVVVIGVERVVVVSPK